MGVDHKHRAVAAFLMILLLSIASCSPNTVRLYDGSALNSGEISRIRGGERAFIIKINDHTIDKDISRRNDYKDQSCAEGKWFELLPGRYTIDVFYSGFITHYNPEYTYIIRGDVESGPFIKRAGSEIYLEMTSSDIQTLDVTLEAGKNYEIRVRLANNPLRPFIRPITPELIAPRHPLLFIVQDLANPEIIIPALRESQIQVTDFVWEASIVELGSEDDIEDKNPENAPLALALESRQTNFAQFLIAAGADISEKTTLGETALHRAAELGQNETIELLLRMGADINAATETGMTPLHLAAENGHIEAVKTLINYGAKVDARNKMGATPLFYAAGNGHTEVARKLHDAGADVHICQKNKWTPLHHAVQGGHEETVRLLLDYGAKTNARTDLGLTPLIIAVNEKYSNIAIILLENGADPDYRDKDGWTPLHFAAQSGDTTVIRLLIQTGAEVSAISSTGCTPLHNAALAGNYDAAELLLNQGAAVNIASNGGWTPLHMAAVNGDARMGRLFIDKGADPGAKLDSGLTALDIAIEKKHLGFVALLNGSK